MSFVTQFKIISMFEIYTVFIKSTLLHEQIVEK
jgi:hypothetical protein